MDVTATLDAPCGAALLFPWIDDLSRYPEWLDIVPRAVPADPHPDDVGPAWSVDLRGRLGPFARAKRLRMVRTASEAPHHARYERVEHDGRDHSPWVLDAAIEDRSEGSRLTMRLHYGGRLWMPVLDRVLADEIERSRPRLLALLG
ncbi:MAG TPA: SRPBCC family protein [Acidimicrobiales bacterium]|nr:SRPBCC family protein [Acidimicrobiales bacterium]